MHETYSLISWRSAVAICLSATALLLVSRASGPRSTEAFAATTPPPVVIERHKVEPLPGELDDVPVLNSNSPEQVQQEGILVSTLPPEGCKVPEAHLNFSFNGRFDIFAHHVAKGSSENLRTVYLGILLHNPGKQKVQVKVLSGASYLSQPDAPFLSRPAIEPDADGTVYSGPGSRVMSDLLRNKRADWLPEKLTVPAGQTVVLASLPIPVKALTPPLNGRSALFKLRSSAPLCAATLAMYAPVKKTSEPAGDVVTSTASPAGGAVDARLPDQERAPSDEEWCRMLMGSGLAGPREKTPTAPDSTGPLIYGRVAGVSRGSVWKAQLSNSADKRSKSGHPILTLPDPDLPYSYLVSSLERGTFGTGQIQSAPMAVRYPDTAYRANGNYGVHYQLELPLYNASASKREVTICLQSPLKSDSNRESLSFYDPAPARVFFRGTALVTYIDDAGTEQRVFYHLVLNQGDHGKPLVKLILSPREQRDVKVEFFYPPDATPPQVMTIDAQLASG